MPNPTSIERRAAELKITQSEPGDVVVVRHVTCGREFDLLTALTHECRADEVNAPDAPTLLSGFIRATLRDQRAERVSARDMLIDVARKLTAVRVAVDDAFEAISKAHQSLNDSEQRQRDAEERLREHLRADTNQHEQDAPRS